MHFLSLIILCILFARSCPALCDPMSCSPPGSYVQGDFPGKNTAASCHSLLQGVILTQGLNPGLPHWQVDSWPSEPPGKYYFVCKLKKWKRKYWSIPNLNTMLRAEFESFNGLFTEFPSSLFSLVPKSCPAVCDPMECSTPGFPVHHQVLEPTLTHRLFNMAMLTSVRFPEGGRRINVSEWAVKATASQPQDPGHRLGNKDRL